jgi:hypothetical protein
MALIDKASLLMVPSTYEAGKLYNVLPSGNRAPDSTDQNSGYDQTRADFDFDRGSNAAATRVNADGVLQKYRENKLLQSNQFDTTWAKVVASVTSGQSGYDGSSDAWLLSKSGSYGRVEQSWSYTGVLTFSVYVKAGTSNWTEITNNTFGYAGFSLDNGTIPLSGGGIIDAKIESVGSGWYRCSITANTSATSTWRVIAGDVGSASASGTTGSIYIQNAQLESGLVSTDYLNSTSVTGKAGVLVDLPRINYDANGENGALLLEPSRQQLIQYSEWFGSSDWTKSGVSVTSGFTSPEGLSNAYKLVEDSSNAQHFIYSSNSGGSVGNKITTSFFVKADTRSWCRIIGYDGSSVWFDLENGVLGTQTNAIGSIEPLSNDWYKISSTYTSSHASNEKGYLYLATGNNSTSYQGDGSSGIYIYGAMLETATGGASYPSSYIPNNGESGGVTRAADDCEKASIGDVVGINEMSFLIEATPLMESNASNPPIFLTLTNNDGQTNISYLQMKSNNEIRFDYYVGGAQQFRITSGVNALEYGTKFKAAVAVKDNDCVLYVNGTQIGTDTSGSTTNLFNQINCGTYVSDAYTGSSIQKLAIFNERLTNEELATLTTL